MLSVLLKVKAIARDRAAVGDDLLRYEGQGFGDRQDCGAGSAQDSTAGLVAQGQIDGRIVGIGAAGLHRDREGLLSNTRRERQRARDGGEVHARDRGTGGRGVVHRDRPVQVTHSIDGDDRQARRLANLELGTAELQSWHRLSRMVSTAVLGVPRPAPPVGLARLMLTVSSSNGGDVVMSGIVKLRTDTPASKTSVPEVDV